MSRLQALVIGLGRFGAAVAQELSARGAEVLAVDIDEDRVARLADQVTEATSFDATDERLLAETNPRARDVCVCSIGDDAKGAAIITTGLLKQLGAKRIVARANDAVNARILRLVGATLVVDPEAEFGQRLASQLLYEEVHGEFSLGGNVLVTDVSAPPSLVGRTLAELNLPKTHGIVVGAVKHADGSITTPRADLKIGRKDTMVLIAEKDALVSWLKLMIG